MSFDLQRILESKRALRRKLAARPVAEKLRLLDELRDRALAIRPPKLSRSGELRDRHLTANPTHQNDWDTRSFSGGISQSTLAVC